MRLHKISTGLLVLGSLGIGLTGCGSDDGGSSVAVNDPTLATGVFIDSPVAGLAYASGSRSGTTGPTGSFTCEMGKTVTFSVGAVKLPAVTCGTSVVTPMIVFGSDINDTRVVNLARLLQTLDKNGNPDDGIEIATEVHSSTTATLPADLNFSDTAAFDSAVNTFIAAAEVAGYTSNTTLVDATTATNHMQDQLTSIVGSWSATFGTSKVLITFFADGSYVHVEDGTADPNGQNGMERGTYTYDAATGAFVSTCPSVDTNGEWGLSHQTPGTCSGTTATVTVSGNAMTFDAGDGTFQLSRVIDATKPVVGSWFFNAGAFHIVVTLFADGTYIHAEDGNMDPAGTDGMERGTYTYNAATGAFVSTCPSVDTNGEWGLSHQTPGTCSGTTATVTVSGNVMTFHVDGADLPLNRVTP